MLVMKKERDMRNGTEVLGMFSEKKMRERTQELYTALLRSTKKISDLRG